MQPPKNFSTKFGERLDQHLTQQPALTTSTSHPSHWRRIGRWLMPNGGTLILIALLIATQSVWARGLAGPSAPGPSANTVNYQGRLADNNGIPLNSTRDLAFAIYDAANDGNLIWGPETHAAVPINNGLFSVGLGSQTTGGIPTTAWSGDRYLEITVSSEILSPRELLRGVPLAGMALTVPDGAIGTSQIADGSVSRAKLAADVVLASVKIGRFDADINAPGWGLNQGSGTRTYTTHVTFDAPYVSTPTVQVSLGLIDMDNATGLRFTVFAENVTNQGFDVVFYTWGDTIVYGARAVWTAVGVQ